MSTSAISTTRRIGSSALVSEKKIRRYGAFYVMGGRLKNMRKYWFSISTGSILNPFFYLASLGLGVGRYINSSSAHGVDGVSYLKFIAPALIASVAINDFNAEVSFPVLGGFKWEKNFYAINSTPITGGQIAIGVWLAGLARVAISSAIYFLILVSFNGASWRAWPIYFSALLAGCAFSSLVLYLAARIKNDDFFLNLLGRVIIMPLFLFSGTFYPLHNSPKPLQWIGFLSPLWHASELGRAISYHHEQSGQMLSLHIAYLAIWIILGLTMAIKTFNRRLAK